MKKPRTIDDLRKYKIAIFGAGGNGVRVWGALKHVGLKPLYFLDNHKTGIERKSGISIIAPEDFIHHNDDIVILISVKSKLLFEEVLTQLYSLGIASEQILVFNEIIQLFEEITFTWENSREEEFDYGQNNDIIEHMANWIEDDDMSVADIGCGNQHLRMLLRPQCDYVPMDYVSRSDDTIICDLNSETLPLLQIDVAFASGVIQYVNNIEKFLAWLCHCSAKKIIIRTKHMYDKATDKFMGYVSTPSIEDIESIIHNHGFLTTKKEIFNNNIAALCFAKS